MANRFRYYGVLLACLCVSDSTVQYASAQLPPMPPLFPSSPQECQRFSEQVTKFYSEMGTQHQKCLDDARKSSKPTPESNQNSLVCSQPSCQYLHDFVYGNKEREAQKQVEDCEKNVADNMRREAERKAESDSEEREYQERFQKRAAERKAEDERRVAERASRDALRAQAEKERSASNSRSSYEADDSGSSNDTVSQTQPNSNAQVSSSSHKKGESKPIALANPYGSSLTAGSSREAPIVDPYASTELAEATPSVVDPYGSEAHEETATSHVAKEIAVNTGKKAIEISVEAVEKTLTADIANAPNVLSGKRLQAYLEDARDTKGVISGLGKMIKASEYATGVAAVLKANDDQERLGAGAHLGLTFAEDAGKKGISSVAIRLFGAEAAAALAGPVGWAAFVGQQVLAPTEISREPTEIIRDNSGHTSLNQKQEALFQMWKQYEKFGANWKEPQRRELLQDSEIVYEQANSGSH